MNSRIVTKELLKPLFLPRKRDTDKRDYGKLAIIGGCKFYSGAPLIAKKGADALAIAAERIKDLGESSLRVGAGLNVIAVPDFLCHALYCRVTESTVFPLKSENGFISFDRGDFDSLTAGVSALCIGMGMGKSSDIGRIIEYSIGLGIPILLDADALNYISEHKSEYREAVKSKTASIIITPHTREALRLFSTGSIAPKERVTFARRLADEYSAIAVLKGPDTVVTDGDTVYVSSVGSPCMAKGGSGDLLCGIIGGLLAQGKDPLLSAAAGPYIAGSAALLAEAGYTQYGVLPTDTAGFIPAVLAGLLS